MHIAKMLSIGILLLTGCDITVVRTLNESAFDGGSMGSMIDLTASSPPRCAAAKGLTGEPLICVDFKTFSNQPLNNGALPAQLMDWSFSKDMTGNGCWEINNGNVQVRNFSTFASSCDFLLPAMSVSDFQKYNIFTVSFTHKLDINKTQQRQTAGIYLEMPFQSQQIWESTGIYPRQVTTIAITKSQLPNGGIGMYRPLFALQSMLAGGGFVGWQIESIAVLGSPYDP